MSISVKKQIQDLSHQYLRHGGKTNRRQQIRRLTQACDWIAVTHNINKIDQIGRRQIISFYQQNTQLGHSTKMGYHYIFCQLWDWLGRNGEPPRPTKNDESKI